MMLPARQFTARGAATAAEVVLLAGQPGRRIVVTSVSASCDGSGDANLRDGSGVVLLDLRTTAGPGVTELPAQTVLMLERGENLMLNAITAAVNVRCTITYFYVHSESRFE